MELSEFLTGAIKGSLLADSEQDGVRWGTACAIQSVITSSYALESSPAWGSLLWASLAKCLNFQEDPTETQWDQVAEDVHIHVIFLCLKW